MEKKQISFRTAIWKRDNDSEELEILEPKKETWRKSMWNVFWENEVGWLSSSVILIYECNILIIVQNYVRGIVNQWVLHELKKNCTKSVKIPNVKVLLQIKKPFVIEGHVC